MDHVLFRDMELTVTRAENDEEDDDNSRSHEVSGYAMVWDDEANLGWSRETFVKGAFKGRMDSTVMLIGHDRGIPLASVNGDTLTLREDKKGLHFTASLSEESQRAEEIMIAVERGDLTDVSIGFSMRPGGEYSIKESEEEEKGALYVIRKVGALNEVSFVYKGAYPKAKISRSLEEGSHIAAHLASFRANKLRKQALNARLRSARI